MYKTIIIHYLLLFMCYIDKDYSRLLCIEIKLLRHNETQPIFNPKVRYPFPKLMNNVGIIMLCDVIYYAI